MKLTINTAEHPNAEHIIIDIYPDKIELDIIEKQSTEIPKVEKKGQPFQRMKEMLETLERPRFKKSEEKMKLVTKIDNTTFSDDISKNNYMSLMRELCIREGEQVIHNRFPRFINNNLNVFKTSAKTAKPVREHSPFFINNNWSVEQMVANLTRIKRFYPYVEFHTELKK